MANGGKRPGAGRPKGSTNRNIKSLRSAAREIAFIVGRDIPDAFEGNGKAFMVAVYKDPRFPIELRLDAAKAAARFEDPMLQAIEHSGNQDKPVQTVTRIERVILRPANTDG